MDTETIGFMPQPSGRKNPDQANVPVEAMRALLERITAMTESQRFCFLAADQAMDALALRKRPDGASDRSLHGVPVTIKDCADQGHATQSGSLTAKVSSPVEDTPIVPRLKARGRNCHWQNDHVGIRLEGRVGSPLTGVRIIHGGWDECWCIVSRSGAQRLPDSGPLHQGSDGAGSIRMHRISAACLV